MTDHAAVLYPSMPSAAPAPAPAAAPIDQPAPQVAAMPAQAQESAPVEFQVREAIDKWVPESIRAERAADVGRKMFPSATTELAAVISEADFADMRPEFAKAVAGEVRAMARDMGLGVPDVQLLRGELDRAMQAPLTPEQRISNRETVVDALNRRYGTDAKQALRDARAFVAADPRRAQILQHVGDTPNVVLRIVELARAAKTARR